MKRLYCIVTAVLLTVCVGLLGSCVKDNEDIVDFDVALQFNPAILAQVKDAKSSTYPQETPFAVTACTLPSNTLWQNKYAAAEPFLNREKVEYKNGMWLPASNCNWPHITKSLSVIAYSPFDANAQCSVVDGIEFNNVNSLETENDLLYTDPVTDMHKNTYGGVVALPFKHALSKISIKVKNLVDTTDIIQVKEIRLPGIKHKGSFKSQPEAQWDLQDDKTELVFFSGIHKSIQAPKPLGETFKIIPQKLDTHFEVDFRYYTAAGTYIDMSLSSRKVETYLQPGRSYTYTLSIGIDEVKFMLEVIDSQLH